MIAVYSELVFADRSLYSFAEKEQGRVDLTLVTALDLPWRADGLQRDGPQVREPVDKLVCAALARAGIAFERVSGSGPARLVSLLAAIDRALVERPQARS
jgi:nicotinamide riboside kinase